MFFKLNLNCCWLFKVSTNFKTTFFRWFKLPFIFKTQYVKMYWRPRLMKVTKYRKDRKALLSHQTRIYLMFYKLYGLCVNNYVFLFFFCQKVVRWQKKNIQCCFGSFKPQRGLTPNKTPITENQMEILTLFGTWEGKCCIKHYCWLQSQIQSIWTYIVNAFYSRCLWDNKQK